jgi:hypothetical protein
MKLSFCPIKGFVWACILNNLPILGMIFIFVYLFDKLLFVFSGKKIGKNLDSQKKAITLLNKILNHRQPKAVKFRCRQLAFFYANILPLFLVQSTLFIGLLPQLYSSYINFFYPFNTLIAYRVKNYANTYFTPNVF